MANHPMISLKKLQQKELIAILILFLISAFFRFYRISEYMTFLGDEGRDALVVKDLLISHNIPFIGPTMSVGNIYLGPLYYYMMAFSMAIWFSPVSAAVMVGVISLITIGLIYYLTRRWFGVVPAFIASTLYSLSPANIIHSHSSWNPNPAPLFAMIVVISFIKALETKQFKWLILAGFGFGAAIQMHYLALTLLPFMAIFWMYTLFEKYVKKEEIKNLWLGTSGAVLGFSLLILPFLLFEIKHHFPNTIAFYQIFFGSKGAVGFSFWEFLVRLWKIYDFTLISQSLTGGNNILGVMVGVLLLAIFFMLYKKSRFRFVILLVWLLSGLFTLGLLKQEIFDHYLNFINPVPFIILGSLWALTKDRIYRGGLLAVVLIIVSFQLMNSPLLSPPNRQLQRTQVVAKYVINKSGSRPYNFALLAERNYDPAYQFYLIQYGAIPQKLPDQKTDQLIVVCEDPICHPVGHPKYEIAAFGWTKIESEDIVEGVKVFKLISNPDQPK